MTKRAYAIVIEQAGDNYGGYVPDLPGCAATGETEAEVRRLLQEGTALYIETLTEWGDRIPPPTTKVDTVIVDVPAAA